jgi:hypothetical protein
VPIASSQSILSGPWQAAIPLEGMSQDIGKVSICTLTLPFFRPGEASTVQSLMVNQVPRIDHLHRLCVGTSEVSEIHHPGPSVSVGDGGRRLPAACCQITNRCLSLAPPLQHTKQLVADRQSTRTNITPSATSRCSRFGCIHLRTASC